MTATDNVKPLCVCNKYKRRIKDNTVEPPVWRYDVSCGQCPQRRATDTEANNAHDIGYPLPRCLHCDAPLMPAIGIMKPHPDNYENLTCYECVTVKKLSCEYGKHIGDKIVDGRFTVKCAIRGTTHATSDLRYPKIVCLKCYKRHKLESWVDYSLRMGSFDKETGEIKELPGVTRELKFTPAHIQFDPMAEHGGMKDCWCPTAGIEGVTRIVDGQRFPNWIAFQPRSFNYIMFREKNTRILRVTRYEPDTLNVENTSLGTVWHSGVNNWIDTVLPTADKKRCTNPVPMGWCYVRITGVTGPSSRHALYTSRYGDVVREAVDNEARRPSIREWVEWCHGQ